MPERIGTKSLASSIPGFSRKTGVKRSADWSDVLRDGEELLWQQRPFPRMRITTYKILCLIAVAAFLWAISSIQSNPESLNYHPKMIIGIFLLLLILLLWIWLEDLIRLSLTRYAYTHSRCIIRSGLITHQINSYAIEFTKFIAPKPGFIGNVYFAEEIVEVDHGKEYQAIGFENIRDADVVYRHLKKLQQSAI